MYIEDIIADGFKSYAQRTVIHQLDPHFNAITGFNGSGKSNILDSICFVLGISNLQNVRASNFQDLVYKQGQAGITKATVSITFNNSDRSKSPVGYEACDQIVVTRQTVIGGRNKYHINGRLAQPGSVQNLFHSVQLNVNNPHFLIMQGRITKVLNMKSWEILSMLEEAAGTRMYEMKKEGALKTLEKKQGKLDEINTVLRDEIFPALDKLRKEKAAYMAWSTGNTELDRLKRFCIAYDFVEAEKVKLEAVGNMQALKKKLEEMMDGVKSLQGEVERKAHEIARLAAEKDAQTGAEMKTLQEKVDELSKYVVKHTTGWTNTRETLATEKDTLDKVKLTVTELEAAVVDKGAALKAAEESMSAIQLRATTAASELQRLEQEQEAIVAGKSTGAEGEKTLEEQLREAKAKAGEAGSGAKQAEQKVKFLEREITAKKKVLVTKQKEAAAMDKELQNINNTVEVAQKRVEALGFNAARLAELKDAQGREKGALRTAKAKVDELRSQVVAADFQYSQPEKNFEHSRVKGVVAKLIRVKDPATITALEVAVGGKLYNVVVDSKDTGKLLLDKGRLKRRVTIIPLAQIQGNPVPAQTQAAAARLVGPENAQVGITLVGYDEELEAAMRFVFGGFFVCKNPETAKQVAFDRSIRTLSVTLEGDLYNPSGTLSGGSRRKGASLLQKLQELADAESKQAAVQQRLDSIEAELAAVSSVEKEHQALTRELEVKSHQLELLKKRGEQSEHHQLSEAVAAMESKLAEAKEAGVAAASKQQECSQLAEQLQKQIEDLNRDRDQRLKDVEKRLKNQKAESAAATKDLKSKGQAVERLALEKEDLQRQKGEAEESVKSQEEVVGKLEAQTAELEAKVAQCKEDFLQAEGELKEKQAKIRECDKGISALAKEQSRLDKKLKDGSVECKKLINQMKRMEEDEADCAKLAEKLLKEHPWIAAERQLFGRPGGNYDFESRDPAEARRLMEQKQEEQTSLSKKINKKVMDMFDKAEQEYQDLNSKKDIVENDKAKIKQVIEELDEKKREALQVTWQKVTKDFGSIFSMLLPGTSAKLEPPEGATFMDGLEVKVAFGEVWKQSLTELSGGQRSLLALSLILALLLFKPAPLYILDEVDAALDLSHTQNIGRMIKSHFPHSQFIVVSLKEGMFNNANVVFRTKFVDGVSTVTRTVPASARQREADFGKGKAAATPNRRRGLRENSNQADLD